MVRRQGESSWSCCSSEASSGGRDAALLVSFGQVLCCSCVVVVAVFGLAGVELLLHSLLVASESFLVLKPLPSIKIWYAVGVLSKKKSPKTV
jgi:hypothetical protein